jgi:hypothetical protein
MGEGGGRETASSYVGGGSQGCVMSAHEAFRPRHTYVVLLARAILSTVILSDVGGLIERRPNIIKLGVVSSLHSHEPMTPTQSEYVVAWSAGAAEAPGVSEAFPR